MLIDVREPIQREMGFIKGSINIPLGELRDRVNELPKNEKLYVSCQVGLRGISCRRNLQQNGIRRKTWMVDSKPIQQYLSQYQKMYL